MTNRGSGWPFVVRDGVDAHFAEIYSSQYTVDDQYDTWVADGTPGYPMINVGEPATSANTIYRAALRACRQVADGGYLGVYIYPESLRDDRMSALVRALDECTGQ